MSALLVVAGAGAGLTWAGASVAVAQAPAIDEYVLDLPGGKGDRPDAEQSAIDALAPEGAQGSVAAGREARSPLGVAAGAIGQPGAILLLGALAAVTIAVLRSPGRRPQR